MAAYTTNITGNEPVTLAEMKLYLRVDHDAEDALIGELITAAREWAETHTEKAIVQQSVTAYFDQFTREIELPLGNVNSVTAIRSDGDVLAPESYRLLVGSPSAVYFIGTLPRAEDGSQSIEVEYSAGYAEAPKRIKQAIKIMVADMYEHREAQVIGQTVAENATLERLLFPVRELTL